MLWPDLQAASLADVPIPELLARGVRGVIVDVDNTLARYRGETPEPAAEGWVHRAREQGLAVYLVSNAMPARVAAMARRLGVEGSGLSRKPFRGGFKRALRSLGLPAREVAVIGDQLFTDVLGGNWLGAMTVLVTPIDNHEALHTRIVRRVERAVLARSPARRAEKRRRAARARGGA